MITKRHLTVIGSLLLLSVFVAGCAGETATPTEALIVDYGMPLAPNVIGQNPSPGEETQLDSSLEIYFDQAMDTSSTSAAFQLIEPEGKALEGQISWPDDRTLRFDPADNLLPGLSYEATLGIGAASTEDIPLAEEVNLFFNTVSQLQVVQVFPTDRSTEVESDTLITVMFNQPVVPLASSTAQAELVQPLSISPSIEGQGEWLNTSVYIFRPDKPLVGGTTYEVTVAAGLRAVSGATETQLSQSVSWQFTTEYPTIRSLSIPGFVNNPPDNYDDVPLNATFAVKFRQSMNPNSTEAAFSLTSYNGESVAGQFEWDEDYLELTFTPARSLALGTGYLLSVDNFAQTSEGGRLKEGMYWNFFTVLPPAIVRVTPANNQVQEYYSDSFEIEFASPMDVESFENRVLISPRPEGELRWQYSSYLRQMTVYGLEPSTAYTVTILSGMTDPYGNYISRSMTVKFRTAARQPSARLQTPGDLALLRAQESQMVYLQYVNVATIQCSLYPMDPKVFVNFRIDDISNLDYKPWPGNLIHTWTEATTGTRDEFNLQEIELRTSEGDPLPPGMYFLGIQSDEISHGSEWLDARILIVATANMTVKSTSADAMLWLTDLESGEPVADVRILVYEAAPGSLALGTTNEDGLAIVDLPIPERTYTERYYFTQDNHHFAFGMTYMGIDVYPSDFGINTNYYLEPNQPAVYIYTDRPIYRPGQTVYFKGILRINDDLDYSLPDVEEVEVSINSYGETVFEQMLPLSSFGSFNAEFTLDSAAALGEYSIQVRYPGEEDSIGWRWFNVAEYRKPEFEVEVQAAEGNILDGDTLEVTVQAEFYSGGPVADSQVEWILRSKDYIFDPTGEYSRYQFYDYERDTYYSLPYAYSEVIAEGEGFTDENGELQITLPIDLSELGSSQRLTLEATVMDLSGNQVSSRVEVIAHWSEFYVGAKAQRYVGRTDEEQRFNLVVLDWDGAPIANETLTVEIVERRWHSVQEIDEFGRSVWTSSVEEIPTTGPIETTTDTDGRASVGFMPPKGGVYRAKVTALDDRGTEARSSAYTWISGAKYVSWRRTNDHSIRLITDRDSYQPGDTAEIMITSPFQGSVYALVTVERGHVRSAEVIELQENSTIYRLPITTDMAPNAYISVVLVKGVDTTSPNPDYRMGLTEITVDTKQQTLNLEITPDKTEAGPGDSVTYTVQATDYAGEPVRAELSFSMVDLALLALAEPNAPAMIDYFYNTRSLTVLTAMPLSLNIDVYNEEIREHAKGGGGGGGGEELGIREVREKFPDTAFWSAQVTTDEDGQASVTVTLPDTLTTWRMDTRAITTDTLVGESTVDMISSKPLLVRPQTPRFLVIGDELTLGTAIHNNTGSSITTTVTLEAEGLEIESDASQQVAIPDGAQAYVQWPVRVEDDVERVDLIFSASGSGYSDASRPTLGTLDGQGIPVYRYEVPETVGTAGELTTGGSRTEAVSLPVFAGHEITDGYLTVSLAPSLVAGFSDGLTYLEHFPYECTEQTVSRFLPNVITMRTLKEAGVTDAELEANLDEQVNIALQRLYNQQRGDGGWGWWPNVESSPLATAYVVHGLIEAGISGYNIDEEVLEDAINYLQEQIQPYGTFDAPYKLNRQAYLLYVLAHAGQAAVSDTVQLYEARQSLALYARAYLAQALHAIDDDDPRLNTLISDFVNHAALSATGTHWNESNRDFWNWNTDTRTTAIVLDTIILIDPSNGLNASAVRWLMANRTQGRWRGTQETVWALLALNRWASVSGDLEPDYRFETALNGESLGGGSANATTLRTTTDLRVGISDLFADQVNRLTIARNNGPGNLYYTTHLMIAMPVNEVQAFSQGITVSRSYYHPDDRETPITSIEQGETFLARLTIIVPNDLHYVFIEDPLPAGVEAVDQSLRTSPQQSAPERCDMECVHTHGWGWWYFDNVELRDEKVVISASYLPAGVYEYIYLVRASTPGSYRVIPPTAKEFYFPEVYGRGEGSLFEVTQ